MAGVSTAVGASAAGGEGEKVIADDRSLNGVYVNGRRVHQAELHHGDEVQIGARVMRFLEV